MELEGLPARALIELPDDELDALLLTEDPIVFRMGSARILGRAYRVGPRLVVELRQVDGGGEGVLRALWCLAEAYARRRCVPELEWRVHAVSCSRPNPKLLRVLERRGFSVESLPGLGPVYRLVHPVRPRPALH